MPETDGAEHEAGPSFSSNAPPQATRQQSWSRFPSPHMSSVPSASYLRSALLGYLSEVEAAVRARLVGTGSTDVTHVNDVYPSSPEMSSEADTTISESDESFLAPSAASSSSVPAAAAATAAATSWGPKDVRGTLRRRIIEGDAKDNIRQANDNVDGEGLPEHQGILPYLSSLRQDILAHFPSLPPLPSSAAQSTTAASEWLKSLPHRLSLVEDSISARIPASPFPADIDIPSLQGARERVIRLVHAMLPSEEWEGWERLGWEDSTFADETPRKAYARHARRISLQDLRKRGRTGAAGEDEEGEDDEDDEDEDEEEPEYLFPNRTPASANAVAFRRRLIRSKSMGAHELSSSRTTGGWGGAASLPMLQRQQSHPVSGYAAQRQTAGPTLGLEQRFFDDYDGEVGGTDDEKTAEEIAMEPELADTKLSKLVAPSGHIGPTVAEALQRSGHGTKLIAFDDLPFVWRNNEHVITGYRFIPLDTARGPVPLIKSAFSWHNETVNIFSHFLPSLFILTVIPLIIVHASPLPDAHPLDTGVLIMYLLAAVACLISSASWHVISGCASRHWFEWGACVDYVGISWLIAASFGTVVYNAYYCHPKTVFFYGSVNVACGALGSILPFQAWFNKRKYKNWRISFFLFLCAAMFAPMVQLFFQHGSKNAYDFVSPFWLSIGAYVAGLLFYGFHFPECIWPGKFDYWGASHQIWHAAIVVAIGLHYRAVFVAHSARYAYSCEMPDAGTPIGELVEGWWHAIFG